MKSEVIGGSKNNDKEKFPRMLIDDDGMVVLRINKEECLTLNSGDAQNGSWVIFDKYSNWDFSRMSDFDGVIQLSND